MPILRRALRGVRRRTLRRMNRAAEASLQQLRQAHEALARGEFDEAALRFGQLADAAAAQALPRAPELAIQAGRAWVLAGDLVQGRQWLHQGLAWMAAAGQSRRLQVAASLILAELRQRGHRADADALEAEVRAMAPSLVLLEPGQMPAAAGSARRRLPPKCPYCGGSVQPATVEWQDDDNAACDYCGSTLQTQA